MDIKQLRYFLAIYEHKSIAKAASSIYISQQGLSMSLLRLESELGCRLLERTREGMVLTSEGEYLYPRAKKMVEEFDEIERYLSETTTHRITIKIACALGAVSEFLAPLLFNFQSRYPKYDVAMQEVSDMDCDEMVGNKKVEMGFGLSPIDTSRFTCMPVFASRLCMLVHKSNSLAELPSVTVEYLRSMPIMVMNKRSKTNLILSQCCQARGFQPNIQYSASEVIAIHRLVAANLGVGISVMSVAKDMANPDVISIPFEEPEMVWQLNMFKLKTYTLSPGAQVMESYLLRHIKKASQEE